VIKHPNGIFWTAILVAWFFDFLFWEKFPGISFPIFAGITLGAGLLLAKGERVGPTRKSLWLLFPILIFSIGTLLRREPLTTFTNYLLTLFLMGVFAHTFRGGRWLNYSLSDFAAMLFYLAVSALAKPIQLLSKRNLTSDEGNLPNTSKPKKWSKILPVFRGLLIAIPIVGIFASLLAAADPVFANYLEDFIQIFNFENLPEYIFRGVYILILGYLLAGIYSHAFTHDKDENLIGEEKAWIPTFLGFTESSIVLGSVNILFVTFVGIQFKYFFGGSVNIKIDGFTYAEYARRGFGELVGVAFLSLLLFLGLSTITRRENHIQRKTFSGLGIGLVVLVALILISAFQRLVLYENVYGFTRLRTYSHIFMVWLGILLAVVVALELLKRQRTFALAALFAAFGFVLTLNLINVDNLIVHQNTKRALNSETFDIQYFKSLSSDAVPALIEAQQNSHLGEADRNELAAILACQITEMADERAKQSWMSYHWSDQRAWDLLTDNREHFSAARIYKDQRGVLFVMANNDRRPCDDTFYGFD
jgi:hypothetical protein